MDTQLKELAKLEKLTMSSGSVKGKSPSIEDSLDTLLGSLQRSRERIQSDSISQDIFKDLVAKVESTKKDIDERQKEIYNLLAKLGKAMDKVRNLARLLSSFAEAFSLEILYSTTILSALVHLT